MGPTPKTEKHTGMEDWLGKKSAVGLFLRVSSGKKTILWKMANETRMKLKKGISGNVLWHVRIRPLLNLQQIQIYTEHRALLRTTSENENGAAQVKGVLWNYNKFSVHSGLCGLMALPCQECDAQISLAFKRNPAVPGLAINFPSGSRLAHTYPAQPSSGKYVTLSHPKVFWWIGSEWNGMMRCLAGMVQTRIFYPACHQHNGIIAIGYSILSR